MTDPEFRMTSIWLGVGIAIGLSLLFALEVFKPILAGIAMAGMPD